jgi:hypothetical protein
VGGCLDVCVCVCVFVCVGYTCVGVLCAKKSQVYNFRFGFGEATTNTQIPASHENVFYNLPIKVMWPFKNAACLENTIFILGDPDVTYPTYQAGQLQPPDKRVRQTVTQFLAQAAHATDHTQLERIGISSNQRS